MKQNKRKAISIIAFRCWSRKNFAVFNSLQKVIKICTLCLAYFIIVIPEKLQAQRSSDSLQIKSYELNEVVVIAGRTPLEAQQAARIVTVITKSEIERAPAQNLSDLLRYIAGVDIRQRGPLGAQADISIRGGTFDQTLILLNGVNITDPQTGHHNLNLPIDIESIERIEIMQGPAAKSFGPNAFNGAINIITGNSKPNHIRVSETFGQFGLYKAMVNISNAIGNYSHFISMNRISSDGYIENTDFSNSNIFYQARYNFKKGAFDFQTGYDSKDFGANGFYSLKYPKQFEATKTEFVSLKYQSNTFIRFAPTFYLRRHLDRFELKRNNDSIPFNHHQTNTAGLNLNVWTVHRLGKTSVGIDFRKEHIKSNLLGNTLSVPIEVPCFDSVYYTKFYARLNTSIYAEHFISWRMLTVTAGAMAHHNSDLAGFKIYPGIDVSYRLNENFKLYLSANKTLRMPTFTDMFYKSPSQQGNPGLNPEEAITLEAGMKYNNPTLKGHVSAFRRWGYKMIDWVKDPSPDSTFWRSLNHTKINFTGIECALTLTPPKTGTFERISDIRISFAFLQADSNRNNMLSKYVLDNLRYQINSSIEVRIAWKLNIFGRLTYHDRNGVYQDAKGQVRSYKPFWLSDAKIYWRDQHYTLYAEASNVFNTRYYDFGGIVQPGIWFKAGIVVNMDYKSLGVTD
ncbi:MAG: TonB-dependent receptor [Bacteroidales bacterium]|nr:TonB-dependent receptor [Bacteroidales bacterium]